MNLKKIITTLSFLLLLSYGYEPIYSEKKINKNYNISINTINFAGDNNVNQILKNKLKKNLNNEKNSTELNFNINSRLNHFFIFNKSNAILINYKSIIKIRISIKRPLVRQSLGIMS